MRIEIDTTLSIYENAAKYFEEAKELKKKAENIRKKIKETENIIKNIEIKISEKKKKEYKSRKKEWYEKFRWFFTSNNFLLIAGKNAITNEIIIKKYLDNKDLVFHADIHGSPFGILKNGKEAKEEDIYEAAKFVGSYSKAWKQKLSYIEVYYVLPEQVSKKAPAGEYLPKGSFMIYGKKNYVRVKLEIAIGEKDGEIILGVPESVCKKTKRYFIIVPGNEKPYEIAKYIANRFSLDINDIIPLIPGESKIIKEN